MNNTHSPTSMRHHAGDCAGGHSHERPSLPPSVAAALSNSGAVPAKTSSGCAGSGGKGSLSCKEICEFLCDYVDGSLNATSKSAFDAHVAACSHCKDYLTTYAETIRLSKRCCCPKLQPPPPLPEDMIKAIVNAVAAGNKQCRDERVL